MVVTSSYKFLRGSACGGNRAWGGLMERQEKAELFFGSSLRRRIFPYATHSKSTSIFNVVWSELQIHHALKAKSGH